MLLLLCPLFRHPPVTTFIYDGAIENEAERQANIARMKGITMLVECACGRKIVDPIWRPRWRA